MFVFFIVFFIGTFSFAQENVFPTNDAVGYQVMLTNVQAGKPFLVQYQMPEDIATLISIDSNINAQADMDITISNFQPKQFDALVTSFSPVSHPMPSLLLTALDTNGQTNQFYTPSFTIPITNEISENTNLTLEDIEKPYFVFNFLWLIILLLIVMCLWIYIFVISKVSFNKSVKEIKTVVDPFMQMNTRLKKLKKQRMELNDDNYKEFFVEISEAVREFLSYTVMPLALETPTRDLLQELKAMKVPEEELEIITFILRSTDRAKYAKQIFEEDRIDQVLNESTRLFDILFIKHQKEQGEKENELRKS